MVVSKALTEKLPDDLREVYEPLLYERGEEEEMRIVKAADKISALIKCIEEREVGNGDFASAEQTIRNSLAKIEFKSVQYFIDNILPCYSMTLDELSGGNTK